MRKTISLDHGNRLMKSCRNVFPSSFVESKYTPPIGGDVLNYDGKTFVLTDQCLPVMNDKTIDERYFILSLFAIGKELAGDAEIVEKFVKSNQFKIDDYIKIDLLIGLPIQHYVAHMERFEKYFSKRTDVIRYEMNGTTFSIKIVSVHAFPQAYSAAMTIHDSLNETNIANIIDIGGFTVDCLQMKKRKPNNNLFQSLYYGVNTLFQSINDQMRSSGGKEICNSIIEGILNKDPSDLATYSRQRVETIISAAVTHTQRMLAEIAQKGYDFEEDKTVFMGGGSILLREYIEQTKIVKKAHFIDDIHANAKGYRLLYDKKMKKINQTQGA